MVERRLAGRWVACLTLALSCVGPLLAQATTEAEVRDAFSAMLEKKRADGLGHPRGSKGLSSKGLQLPARMETHTVTTVTDEDLATLGTSRGRGTKNIVPTPRKRPADVPKVEVMIPFKIDSHELSENAPPLLDQVVNTLKAPGNDAVRLSVNGHTDSKTGGLEHNMQLSHLRSASVMKYLIEKGGVSRERFEGHGYGPRQPRFDENTPEGIEKNRRVEFELLADKETAGKQP